VKTIRVWFSRKGLPFLSPPLLSLFPFAPKFAQLSCRIYGFPKGIAGGCAGEGRQSFPFACDSRRTLLSVRSTPCYPCVSTPCYRFPLRTPYIEYFYSRGIFRVVGYNPTTHL
jgi:hypothetical protein